MYMYVQLRAMSQQPSIFEPYENFLLDQSPLFSKKIFFTLYHFILYMSNLLFLPNKMAWRSRVGSRLICSERVVCLVRIIQLIP